MVRLPQIKVTPPGPKAKRIMNMDHQHMATSTKAAPIAIERGRGAVVYDVDGNAYIDFSSGVAVLNVGHCHPRVVKAIREQAGKFTHFAGTDFYYEVQARLAERLAKLMPGPSGKKVFFSNSGAESVEAAMKIARWSTQRKRYISFMGAFHGRTLGALSLTASKVVQQERYFPTTPGVTHLPYANCYRCPYKEEYPGCGCWCAKVIEEMYFDSFLPADEVAGLFFEPIQGEGGYIVPPKDFAPTLAKMCKKHGILFIDDEVQAGIGRTGKMWAIEHYGVVPDVVCSAKSLGGGVPIAATIFREDLDFTKFGAHSNTYGGNPVACAAALAVLDILSEEKLIDAAAKKGEHLKKRLQELMERHELIGDVRGYGLMLATEFVKDRTTKEYAVKERDAIVERCARGGLILLGCGRSAIRYIPPLVATIEQLDAGIDILAKVISEVERK